MQGDGSRATCEDCGDAQAPRIGLCSRSHQGGGHGVKWMGRTAPCPPIFINNILNIFLIVQLHRKLGENLCFSLGGGGEETYFCCHPSDLTSYDPLTPHSCLQPLPRHHALWVPRTKHPPTTGLRTCSSLLRTPFSQMHTSFRCPRTFRPSPRRPCFTVQG